MTEIEQVMGLFNCLLHVCLTFLEKS